MNVNRVLEIIRCSFGEWTKAFDDGSNLSDVDDGRLLQLWRQQCHFLALHSSRYPFGDTEQMS